MALWIGHTDPVQKKNHLGNPYNLAMNIFLLKEWKRQKWESHTIWDRLYGATRCVIYFIFRFCLILSLQFKDLMGGFYRPLIKLLDTLSKLIVFLKFELAYLKDKSMMAIKIYFEQKNLPCLIFIFVHSLISLFTH